MLNEFGEGWLCGGRMSVKLTNVLWVDETVKRAGAGGRTCPNCGRPLAKCASRASPRAPRGDGVVRVSSETKGRSGKTVTVVRGIPLAREELRALAGELKRTCGSGGAVKDREIEIQGDHVETLLGALESRGYTVSRTPTR